MKEVGRSSSLLFAICCLLMIIITVLPLATLLFSHWQYTHNNNNNGRNQGASSIAFGGKDAKIIKDFTAFSTTNSSATTNSSRFLLSWGHHHHGQEQTTTTTTQQQKLPPAEQSRVKGVNTKCLLDDVLAQGTAITAIEADILMGQCTTCDDPAAAIPVMGHPPETCSDLSMDDFLDAVSIPLNDGTGQRALTHHIKLDFKDIDAVHPTLQAILDKNIVESSTGNVFYLNADVVAGPGYNDGEFNLDPNVFIPLGIDAIQQQLSSSAAGVTNIAWSLGFRTRFEDPGNGYEISQLQQMNDVINTYNLLPSSGTTDQGLGVVLAVNARQLEKSLDVVSSQFLQGGIWQDTTVDQIQLLAWLGQGEPPISRVTVDKIQNHFRDRQLLDRIGFDLTCISESKAIDFWIDCFVGFLGIFSC